MAGGNVARFSSGTYDDAFFLANRLDHDDYSAATNGSLLLPLDIFTDPNWVNNHWQMHQSLADIIGAPLPFDLSRLDLTQPDPVWYAQHVQTHALLDIFYAIV